MTAWSPQFDDDDEGLLPKWAVVAVPIVILLACWLVGTLVIAAMERA